MVKIYETKGDNLFSRRFYIALLKAADIDLESGCFDTVY